MLAGTVSGTGVDRIIFMAYIW